MTFKIIEVLKFIRGKTLHIFLCLVLIFAFCFKDSVPSAEAANVNGYPQEEEYDGAEMLYTADQTEAVTAYTETEPTTVNTGASRLPSVGGFADKTTQVPIEAETTTREQATAEDTAAEETTAEETTAEETTAEITTDEETTDEETTAEETTVAETAAEETAAEETETATEMPAEENIGEESFALSGSYGQRYQEQWEIDYANQLFDLVNNERAKYGLAPLKKMDALTAAAVERAWEVTRYNSHTRPDGTSCFTVLSEYGLPLSKRAENIAYYSRTPQEAFNSLMGSYSHREPILNERFEYMGVGFYCVYDDASGYHYYWTQIFYTP